jgi:hypothetical protein
MKVTLNYGEMLQAPDRPKLVQAMQSKMEGLKEILKIIRREDIPTGNRALPAVWAFRRKDFQTGPFLSGKHASTYTMEDSNMGSTTGRHKLLYSTGLPSI